VLLSRGRRGCFVWCADPSLRDYLRDRLRIASRTFRDATVAAASPAAPTAIVARPPPGRGQQWVPVYTLAAAAGEFGPPSPADRVGWVASPGGVRTDERHFAARVHGRSMEPLIPDGALCLFRRDVAGSRGGRVLLVQHRAISDPESGGSFTVKRYRSLKVESEDAGDERSWTHSAIQLLPINAEFPTIWINPDQVDDVRVIAEFVCIVG